MNLLFLILFSNSGQQMFIYAKSVLLTTAQNFIQYKVVLFGRNLCSCIPV